MMIWHLHGRNEAGGAWLCPFMQFNHLHKVMKYCARQLQGFKQMSLNLEH
jgi:hypothetical protein